MRVKKVHVSGAWPKTTDRATVRAVLTEEPRGDCPTLLVVRRPNSLIGIVLTPAEARNLAIDLLDVAHEARKVIR